MAQQQRFGSSTGGASRPGQQGGRDGGFQRGGQGGNNPNQRNNNRRDPNKKKLDPLKLRQITYLDYRDVRILERFLNDRGKILPNRITGVTAKAQRRLEESIKHARHLALLPFVAEGLK
jgi:small subunit ribosomal protein S18